MQSSHKDRDNPTGPSPARPGILSRKKDTNARLDKTQEDLSTTTSKPKSRRDVIFSKNWRIRSQSEEPLLGDAAACDVSTGSALSSSFRPQPARENFELSYRRRFGGSYDSRDRSASISSYTQSSESESQLPLNAAETDDTVTVSDDVDYVEKHSLMPKAPPSTPEPLTESDGHESTTPELATGQYIDEVRSDAHDMDPVEDVGQGSIAFPDFPLGFRLPLLASLDRDSMSGPQAENVEEASESELHAEDSMGYIQLPVRPLLPLYANPGAEITKDGNKKDDAEADFLHNCSSGNLHQWCNSRLPAYAMTGVNHDGVQEARVDIDQSEDLATVDEPIGAISLPSSFRFPLYPISWTEEGLEQQQSIDVDSTEQLGGRFDLNWVLKSRLPLPLPVASMVTETPAVIRKSIAWNVPLSISKTSGNVPAAGALCSVEEVTRTDAPNRLFLSITPLSETELEKMTADGSHKDVVLGELHPVTESAAQKPEAQNETALDNRGDGTDKPTLPLGSGPRKLSNQDAMDHIPPPSDASGSKIDEALSQPVNPESCELTEDRRRFDALVSRLQKKLSQDRESEESQGAASPLEMTELPKTTDSNVAGPMPMPARCPRCSETTLQGKGVTQQQTDTQLATKGNIVDSTDAKSRKESGIASLNPKASKFVSLSAHGSQLSSTQSAVPVYRQPDQTAQSVQGNMQPAAPGLWGAPPLHPWMRVHEGCSAATSHAGFGSATVPMEKPVQATRPILSNGVVSGPMASLNEGAAYPRAAYPGTYYGHQENRPPAPATQPQPSFWTNSISGSEMPVFRGVSRGSETLPPKKTGPWFPRRRGMKPRGRIPFQPALSADEQQTLEQHLEELRATVPYFALLSKKRQKARWEAQQAQERQRQRQSEAWQQMDARSNYMPPGMPPGMHQGGSYPQTWYGRPEMRQAPMASFMQPPAPPPAPVMARAQMAMPGMMPYGYGQGQAFGMQPPGQVPGAYMTL